MKAKSVFETLEFERGRNPKEAMDIGILNAAKADMLERGYKYNGADSLLRFASEFNKPEYIDLAMSMNADVSLDKGHVIELATVAGNPEAIEALLKHGAQPDWVSDYTYKWILPNWRNDEKFMKMDPEIADRYIRSRKLLQEHPNFTS